VVRMTTFDDEIEDELADEDEDEQRELAHGGQRRRIFFASQHATIATPAQK
jgi:hypothetical protein